MVPLIGQKARMSCLLLQSDKNPWQQELRVKKENKWKNKNSALYSGPSPILTASSLRSPVTKTS